MAFPYYQSLANLKCSEMIQSTHRLTMLLINFDLKYLMSRSEKANSVSSSRDKDNKDFEIRFLLNSDSKMSFKLFRRKAGCFKSERMSVSAVQLENEARHFLADLYSTNIQSTRSCSFSD